MSTQPVERQPRHLQSAVPLTLAELAAIANRSHAAHAGALREGLEHAVKAGEALRQARDIIGHGGWLKWLAENFRGSQSTARRYMRCAEHKDRLSGHMTTQDAMEVLLGLPAERTIAAPDAVRAEAVALVNNGVSYDAAAKTLGVSHSTVHRWANPEKASQWRRQTAERDRKAREALAKQEREKAIRAAVRKAGAALAEAYSMANRYGAVLAQAEQEVTSDEARAALERAGAYHRKMADEIVRALGVS
jgi:transposase